MAWCDKNKRFSVTSFPVSYIHKFLIAAINAEVSNTVANTLSALSIFSFHFQILLTGLLSLLAYFHSVYICYFFYARSYCGHIHIRFDSSVFSNSKMPWYWDRTDLGMFHYKCVCYIYLYICCFKSSHVWHQSKYHEYYYCLNSYINLN